MARTPSHVLAILEFLSTARRPQTTNELIHHVKRLTGYTYSYPGMRHKLIQLMAKHRVFMVCQTPYYWWRSPNFRGKLPPTGKGTDSLRRPVKEKRTYMTNS